GGGIYGSLGFAYALDTPASKNIINFSYRKRTAATGNASSVKLMGVNIEDGKSYEFEMYCNNTSATQYYTKGENQYIVPPTAMHVWVDGIRVGEAINTTINYDLISIAPNVTGTNENIVGEKLYGIMFTGIAS